MAIARTRELLDIARVDQPQELPLNDHDIFNLFLHLLRDHSLFAQGRQLLRHDLFDLSVEPHYRLFWLTVLEFWEQHGEPHYAALAWSLDAKLQTSPGLLSPRGRDLLLRPDYTGLLYYCAYCPAEHLLPSYGRQLFRRFLLERSVIYPFRSLMSQGGSRAYTQQFGEMIEAVVAKSRQIDSLQVAPVAAPIPQRGTPLPPPDVFIETGIPHFDNFIRGQRPGDCNGILGISGAGKTTQCTHLAVQNARNFFALGRSTNTKPKLSIFLSYEEPESKIQKRIWANACQIPLSKLEQMQDWSELTTQNNLAPYEYRLAAGAANSGYVNSETERWDEAHHWLNQSFRFLDMSGSEKYPGYGAGYIDEVVSSLERLASDIGAEIGAVHIDYAKILVRRYMEAKGMSEDKIRHLLGSVGDDLRRRVSEHFNCTTWLMHQIAPDQNKSSPMKLLKHTDAAEAKAFAENMAVCGVLGVKDPLTGCILLNWSKVRYNDNRSQTQPVLQIDYDFYKMIDVSSRYSIDATSRSFIDPNTRHQIGGELPSNPVSDGPEGLAIDDMGNGDY